MSYPSPEGQPPLAPYPPQPKRRSERIAVLVAVVAVVVAAAAVTYALLNGGADESAGTDDTPAAFDAARATATTTTATYTHTPYVPTPEDFDLEVQVLEQKCFGSAGCHVTFKLAVSYTGETIYDGEGPYTVVYNVAGTEDPYVGRFTLISQYELSATEEFVSTPPGATVTAAVTQVF